MTDVPESPWGGWEVSGLAYHVGPYPQREKIALYWSKGTISEPVAYFRSDTDALVFLHWLNKLAASSELSA